MKHSLLYGILLFTVLVMVGYTARCQAPSYNINPRRLVLAETAKKQMHRYRDVCKDSLHVPEAFIIKAFTIQDTDLYAALGVPLTDTMHNRYKNIRVYLAFNDHENEFKLYIVPVEGAVVQRSIMGDDLVFNSEGIVDSPAPKPCEPLGRKYVLDLNAPCPNLCPEKSPFMSKVPCE